MTATGDDRTAVALERLKGSMDTGFAKVSGEINLLARGMQSNSENLDKIDDRVSQLEERRFPLSTTGGIMGFAGVIVSGYVALKGG